MKTFWETDVDYLMSETKWAQNWIKKPGLFHTKCLSLVFSRAMYWKYFFNLDCKARAMTAQYGFLWPKRQQQTFHLHIYLLLIFSEKKKKSRIFLFEFSLWRIKIKTTYTLRLHKENRVFTNSGVIRWKFRFQVDVQFLFLFIKASEILVKSQTASIAAKQKAFHSLCYYMFHAMAIEINC